MQHRTEKNHVLLSTAYLGPIQYFSKLIFYDKIDIEKHENYTRQTYRNRCVILGANGYQTLVIPVKKEKQGKVPVSDVRISYDEKWQRLHWMSIISAYNNSPFFEYLSDDFAPFYHKKKWKYLLDFNMSLQEVVLKIMDAKPTVSFTTEYIKAPEKRTDDYRYAIHPKLHRSGNDPNFTPSPYIQVFSEKLGFVPNLSIIDLLFNEGTVALSILKESSNYQV